MSEFLTETKAFLEVVEQLRKKCPWDQEQTHESLLKYLIEETYETVDAIESQNPKQMKEELGDLLLQIALHAEIANEQRWFNFEDISKAIKEKMIVRHPHVFGTQEIRTSDEQTKNWQKLKAKEKKNLLEGAPRHLPSLALAQKYGDIAATIKFDWPDIQGVVQKIDEELQELKVEIQKKDQARAEEELGDLLFTLTRLASHLKLDAETTLRQACKKFQMRFTRLENELKKSDRPLDGYSLTELDEIWNRIKQ